MRVTSRERILSQSSQMPRVKCGALGGEGTGWGPMCIEVTKWFLQMTSQEGRREPSHWGCPLQCAV